MAVGGPGRLLPAGGGEDGRFPEGAPCVQQEQLQQIPCGFRLQGFQPPALGVFAHQRIPLGTDYRDREDKHPPALPPPAVGQKERSQEAGAGAGGCGGGELGAAAQDRPDRQPGHDRGHLNPKNPGTAQFPELFPLPAALFIWDLPRGLCRLYLWALDGGGRAGAARSKFPLFSVKFLEILGCPRIFYPQNSHFFFARNSVVPKIFYSQFSPFFPPQDSWRSCVVPEFFIPKFPLFFLPKIPGDPVLSQNFLFPNFPFFSPPRFLEILCCPRIFYSQISLFFFRGSQNFLFTKFPFFPEIPRTFLKFLQMRSPRIFYSQNFLFFPLRFLEILCCPKNFYPQNSLFFH